MKRVCRVAAAVAVFLGGSLHAASSTAGNMTLNLSGFAAPLDILSFNVGGQITGGFGGGGGGAGATSFQDASFLAPESAASPLEFAKLATGQHLASARLQVLSSTTAQPVSEWTFTDVVVNSISVDRTGVAGASSFIHFTLFYNKILYKVFAADGSVAQQMCWDLVLKASC